MNRLRLDPYTIMADAAISTLLAIARAEDPVAMRDAFFEKIGDLDHLNDIDRPLATRVLELLDASLDRPGVETRLETIAERMNLPADDLAYTLWRVTTADALIVDQNSIFNFVRRVAGMGYNLRQLDSGT
jgi:hypothetical protein